MPDNATTATYRPVKNKPGRRIQERYADFADYYDILLVPGRPRKPRDKAAVERAVQLVHTRILGYFDGITFYGLDELNEAIAQRVDDINMNMPRPDGLTRRELFDADEAPMMRDLPDTPFTEVSWRAVKVDRNWHICCDYQYYSVPFQYIGKILRARLTNSLVSIFDGDDLVAEHSRMHGFKYRYCTDPGQGYRWGQTAYQRRAACSGLVVWAGNHQGCLLNFDARAEPAPAQAVRRNTLARRAFQRPCPRPHRCRKDLHRLCYRYCCLPGRIQCRLLPAEYSVAYYRLDQLVDELAAFSPADQRYVAKMRRLQNVDVLILDDFLTQKINQRGQEDLTKIIFDRDGRLPTIIVSQTTAAYWIKKLPDPIGADSLVSRLNAGQPIELGDYDMRQHLAHAQTTVDS